MAEIGAFLSSEEHDAPSLVRQAAMAEAAGIRAAMISDHFHPWVDAQGESPFVWSVIGAISAATSLRVTTGVTCPTVRIHPAIVAQAAATASQLLDGRFALGVGSGEALNEHILGDHWPPVDTRLEMLEEAVTVMRALWEGSLVTHHGAHYNVENARIYSLGESPPPVIISAFGPEAAEVAARIGDGLVTVGPNADLLERYRSKGGQGTTMTTLKVCWDHDEGRARKLVHQLWPTEALGGQLSQELALPAHFEAATEHVSEDQATDSVPCGPDPERHVAAITKHLEAGFDQVYVNQIGPEQEGFFSFYAHELAPRLGL